jgi:hypothetical protein
LEMCYMKVNNFMAFWKWGYKWTWRYAWHKVTTKARMLVTPILLMFMFYFHFVSKWYFFSRIFQRGNYNFKLSLLSHWNFCSLCVFYYFVVLTSYFFLWLSILIGPLDVLLTPLVWTHICELKS